MVFTWTTNYGHGKLKKSVSNDVLGKCWTNKIGTTVWVLAKSEYIRQIIRQNVTNNEEVHYTTE
jgi:hypothetical protein